MLAEFGFGVLLLALIVALFSVGAAIYGYFSRSDRWVESARRSLLLTFPLISLTALTLIYELATGHYELQYVYSVTSNEMPFYLKITALWGGQAGSLIFWSWLLSAFASAVAMRKWDRDQEFLPWVVAVTAITLAFFLSLSIFFENPFTRWWQTAGGGMLLSMFPPQGATLLVPPDGQGLNELLRHPGMIIHPPMLYLGFVSFVIPYAFAMAALITGRVDDRWIRITRRWTLWAWLFLSCGLVLGMWWAYDVLGWGGYWGWDSSEVAALLPWLVGTAFLHTVIIQEKRGMFKPLNIILIILTYVMVIVATFLIRSGLLSSVHAFAQSTIGYQFIVFIAIMLVISVGLLIYRWKDLQSEASISTTSLWSREALFLLAALIFGGIFIVCFWGIFFPIISEALTNQRMTVGPPWYKQAVGPLFASLLLLMGLATLSSWTYGTLKTIGRAVWKPVIPTALLPIVLFVAGMRNVLAYIGLTLAAFALFVTLYEFGRGVGARARTHSENLLVAFWRQTARKRRRLGGILVHLSMVMMALAIIGIEMFQTTTQKSLAIGQSIELSGYTIRYDSLAQFPYVDGRIVTRAVLSLYRNGQYLGELHPRYDLFPDGQPMAIPAIRSTLADDVYVVLVDWENLSTAQTPFKVYHNPLVMWLWVGSFVFILGILITAWPEREIEPAAVRVNATVPKLSST
ncbi:MAG TPA: cytochrome c-type biogenesis CcmF C-terminal domain-containing protein [Anaerolineales bacterium]|nr:cytochrome c-type biogenesis CcmF C-terminal domain-containing protein [Anaerolineales bacterium]